MTSKIVSAFAVLFSAAAGVAIGVGLHVRKPWLLLIPSHDANPPIAAGQGKPAPSASTAPSTNASASASPAGSSSASAAGGEGPAACMRSLFAEDTFDAVDPDLAKLCEDKSSSKFGKRVKEILVADSHGKMTGGMKEWGILGIYDLAAMAAMRGACCPGAPALEVAGPPGSCPALGTSLAAITKAASPGGTSADLDAAVATFDKDVHCVIRSEQTQAFGDYGPLGGGEGTALDKTIRRIRPAAKN